MKLLFFSLHWNTQTHQLLLGLPLMTGCVVKRLVGAVCISKLGPQGQPGGTPPNLYFWMRMCCQGGPAVLHSVVHQNTVLVSTPCPFSAPCLQGGVFTYYITVLLLQRCCVGMRNVCQQFYSRPKLIVRVNECSDFSTRTWHTHTHTQVITGNLLI